MSLITITQSKGCAGEKIAKLVADSLNLELYDEKIASILSTPMSLCRTRGSLSSEAYQTAMTTETGSRRLSEQLTVCEVRSEVSVRPASLI